MENRYNLDLSVLNPTKTSTSLVGQLRMLEIPNLNVVYEDETVTCYIHDIAGEKKLFVFHAVVIPSTDKKLLNHYLTIVDSLDEALKERGFKELEAWVNTDEEIRYAMFFGFTEYLGELTVNGQTCFPQIHRLRKTYT